MPISKIRLTDDETEIHWTTEKDGLVLSHECKSEQRPLPALIAAVASFRPHLVDVLQLPEQWAEPVRVTVINVSITEGRRGLVVTGTRPIERAHNRPLVLNTPLMREPAEGTTSASGVYDAGVDKLIDQLERAAIDYINGKREQAELFASEDGDEDEADDEGEQAEGAEGEVEDADVARAKRERRKRAKGKGKRASKGKGKDAPTVAADDEGLRKSLLEAGRDVPLDAIANWTSTQRDSVVRWAYDAERVREGIITESRLKPEPKVLQLCATPALLEQQIPAGTEA